MMKPHIEKTHLKNITIAKKYTYRIFLVNANGNEWLEAQPVWKGVVRSAENENILRIILENDAIQLEKQQHRTR